MKIRFLANTNIRLTPYDLSIPQIGIIFGGMEIEVENSLYNGVPISGIHTYFRDKQGWYYWSGKAIILYSELPPKPEDNLNETTIVKEESKINIFGYPPKDTQQLTVESTHEVVPEETIIEPEEEEKKDIVKTSTKADTTISRGIDSITAPAPNPELPSEPTAVDFSEVTTFSVVKNTGIPSLFWQKNQLTGTGINVVVLHKNGVPNSITPTGITFGNSKANLPIQAYLELIGGKWDSPKTGIAPQINITEKAIPLAADPVDALQQEIIWSINQGADIVLILTSLKKTKLNEVALQKLQKIINDATQRGVLFIAPTGKSDFVKTVEIYPSTFENCLCVGAHTAQKQRLMQSQKNRMLDILAPGYDDGSKIMPFPTYWAAAYTTGVLALILEKLQGMNRQVSVPNLLNLIKNTAQKTAKNQSITEAGNGIFSPEKILSALESNAYIKKSILTR